MASGEVGAPKLPGDATATGQADGTDAGSGSGSPAARRTTSASPKPMSSQSDYGCLLLIVAGVLLLVGVVATSCMGPSKSGMCSDMYGPSYHYSGDDGGYCVNTYNGDRRPFD